MHCFLLPLFFKLFFLCLPCQQLQSCAIKKVQRMLWISFVNSGRAEVEVEKEQSLYRSPCRHLTLSRHHTPLHHQRYLPTLCFCRPSASRNHCWSCRRPSWRWRGNSEISQPKDRRAAADDTHNTVRAVPITSAAAAAVLAAVLTVVALIPHPLSPLIWILLLSLQSPTPSCARPLSSNL